MRDILYPGDPDRPKDVYTSARKSMERPLPKRFYKEATFEAGPSGFRILLDGKPALTPGRKPLALATAVAAAQIAAEWNAAEKVIDPSKMHATRMANIGIDRVDAVRDAVIEEAVKYARSDLVCYRAAMPEDLVALEDATWNGVLDHARSRYGANFVLSQGIGFAEQSESAVAAIRAGVARIADPVALAAFQTMASIAGSVLIPLAWLDGALDTEAAFSAGSVEEDWNARLWGADAEAVARRERRHAEFLAAAELIQALGAR